MRLERGWTIERAAEKFAIEPAHVRRIEASEANPSLAVLASIAKALGLSVSDLVHEEAHS
jgi:transcriptional regulator with XRE-family HTH domain